jgi:hypothetical protein
MNDPIKNESDLPNNPDQVQPQNVPPPEDDLLDTMAHDSPSKPLAKKTVAKDSIPDEAPKASQESSSSPTNNDGLTKRVKDKTKQMRQHTPRQYKFTLAIVIVGILGVVGTAIILFRDGGSSRSKSVQVKPTAETSADVDAKFKIFMANQKELLPKLIQQVAEIESRQSTSEKTLKEFFNESEAKRASDARFMREEIERITKLLGEQGTKGQVISNSGDFDGFTQILIKQKATTGLTLEEARLRLTVWLEQNGFKANALSLMRDKGLDQLGFIYVGEVQEAPLSPTELSDLPEQFQPYVKELAKFNLESGLFQGLVVFREAEALKWFEKRIGQVDKAGLTDAILKKGAFLARVRKDNVSPEQEALLPDLAAERDAKGIAPTDLFRTEAYVFGLKSKWPAMTPGQHLSLAMTLAGLRANGSNDLMIKLRDATNQDMALIQGQAKDAVRNALQQGVVDQPSLIKRGRNAINTKAIDLKVSLTDSAKEQLTLVAVADAMKEHAEGPTTANPVLEALQSSKKPSPDDKETDKNKVHKEKVVPTLMLGSLSLTRDKARYAGFSLIAIVCERLKIDPNTSEGVCLISALLSSSPSVTESAWNAVHENNGNLRDFSKEALTEFHALINRARGIFSHRPEIPGLDPAVSDYLTAIEIGIILGESNESDPLVLKKLLNTRLKDLVVTAKDFRLPEASVTGLDRLMAVWKQRRYSLLIKPERFIELTTLVREQLIDRKVAHEQIVLPGFTDGFRKKALDSLSDDIAVSLPTIIANRDDGNLPMALLRNAVVKGSNYYAAGSLAEAMLISHGIQQVSQSYASVIDEDGMIPPLFASLAQWVPDSINALLTLKRPDIGDADIANVAKETNGALADEMQQFIIKSIIKNNIDPRIKSKAGSLNNESYLKAMAFVAEKLDKITIDPPSISHIDELTMELHQDALSVLQNPNKRTNYDTTRSKTPTTNTTPSGKPGFFEIKDQGLPGIPIGMRKETINSGKVYGIPAGSAMQVYLEIGQDVALKGSSKSSDLVQLRCRGGFFSPSGTWFQFPACVLQGRVKPNPGGDRNMVEIEKIIVEVNGIAVEKEMKGTVTDEEDGIAGMIAKFERHLDKILPEAAVLSLTSGIAEGLAATQDTTTVVVPGATTQATQTGNAVQYGIGEGLQKGVDIIQQYQESYLDEISPTLKSWNGQKLVAQFFSTVEFPELTEQDWLNSINSSPWNGF